MNFIANKTFARRAICTAVTWCVLATTTSPATAGFLDDFYADAGSFTNATPASVTSGQGGSVVAGGSFMVRNRNRNVQPFWFNPPSLKAGCGGIDVFLGAIGIASKDEFIALLKNIGQMSPVLAFQIALGMISPDTAEWIQKMVSKLDMLNQANTSACQASKRMLAGAADLAIESGLTDAVGISREAGGTSDHYSSLDQFKRSVKNVTGYAVGESTERLNADGTTTRTTATKKLEGNMAWKSLSQAFPSMSVDDKRLLMSVVGTVVIKNVPDSTGAAQEGLVASPFPATVDFKSFISATPGATVTLNMYGCGSDTATCLTPTVSTSSSTSYNFWGKVTTAARNYQSALRNRDRTLVTNADFGLLSSTSVPLIRAINVVTVGTAGAQGDAIVDTLTQIAAYDLVAQAIDRAAAMVNQSTLQLGGVSLSAGDRAVLDQMRKDIDKMRGEMATIRHTAMQAASQAASFVSLLEHFEKGFSANTTRSLAHNLAFNR